MDLKGYQVGAGRAGHALRAPLGREAHGNPHAPPPRRPNATPPAASPQPAQALVWTLSAVLIAAFVAFALVTAYLRRRRLRGSMRFNQEEFITARAQVKATLKLAKGGLLAAALGRQLDMICGSCIGAARRVPRPVSALHASPASHIRATAVPPTPLSCPPAGRHAALGLVLLRWRPGRMGHLRPALVHGIRLQLWRRRYRPGEHSWPGGVRSLTAAVHALLWLVFQQNSALGIADC